MMPSVQISDFHLMSLTTQCYYDNRINASSYLRLSGHIFHCKIYFIRMTISRSDLISQSCGRTHNNVILTTIKGGGDKKKTKQI